MPMPYATGRVQNDQARSTDRLSKIKSPIANRQVKLTPLLIKTQLVLNHGLKNIRHHRTPSKDFSSLSLFFQIPDVDPPPESKAHAQLTTTRNRKKAGAAFWFWRMLPGHVAPPHMWPASQGRTTTPRWPRIGTGTGPGAAERIWKRDATMTRIRRIRNGGWWRSDDGDATRDAPPATRNSGGLCCGHGNGKLRV